MAKWLYWVQHNNLFCLTKLVNFTFGIKQIILFIMPDVNYHEFQLS